MVDNHGRDQRGGLSVDAARASIFLPEAGRIVVTELEGANRVWRLDSDLGTFYLKTHTRSWYDRDPPVAAGMAVARERYAYAVLAAHGLATPAVVATSENTRNALGWPYLLLRGLTGRPLPVALCQGDRDDADKALRSVGSYLRAMHEIQFDYPGALIHGAPSAPPDPDAWQHPMWRWQRFLAHGMRLWSADGVDAGPRAAESITELLRLTSARLPSRFEPPRFVQGDCHASALFVQKGPHSCQVTGLLDMEVASAGCPLFDLAKLVIEMAGRFRARRDWWNPLLAGYASDVDLDLLRLILLGHDHVNYRCHGQHSWPGSRSEIVCHLLAARTWEQVANLDAIEPA